MNSITDNPFIQKILSLSDMKFAGNYTYKYFIAIVVFIASFCIIKFLASIGIKQLKKFTAKTKVEWDDFLIHLISKNSTWFSLLLSLYIGVSFIRFTNEIQKMISSAFVILITFIAIKMGSGLLTYWFKTKYFEKDKDDVAKASIMQNMLLFSKVLLWLGGVLFILDNLGFDITTAVAGLGIGGMAIALASQNILSDIFSYFTIFFDKPFEVGDYIIIGGNSGTVEHIGIKTTRIKSLQGEQLVYGNSDLIKSCISNFKKMQTRRICHSLGVTYETPADKLKKVPDIIRNVISRKTDVKLDRIHFKSFGDFSLNFEYVYYVLSSSYLDYMNIQQEINFELFEAFTQAGIDFAYPTQTLFMNNSGARLRRAQSSRPRGSS